MSVKYSTATTDDELHQILSLQRTNHASSFSETNASKDGFVTVMHSFKLLQKMNEAAPQIIAKDGQKVIGYALVMLRSFVDMIPVLRPMFDRLATIKYGECSITDHSFYIMGQICIDKLYRGTGVFNALYEKHRKIHSDAFELCVTSVSTRNHRSMRAHERVGFQVVDTFRDATDEWSILVCQL